MQRKRWMMLRGFAAVAVSLAVVVVSGCGNFFVYPGSITGGGGGTTSNTGDWIYISNSSAGPQAIGCYSVTNGALAVISNCPLTVSYQPSAMVVNASNTILYVATQATTTGGYSYIYAYTLSSTGFPTLANNGNPVLQTSSIGTLSPVSIDLTPDGTHLFVLDATGVLYNYTTNGSNTLSSGVYAQPFSGSALAVSQVRVAPNSNYVVVALGLAGASAGVGDVVYPLSSGSLGTPYNIGTGSASSADYAIAIDTNNNVYVGRSGTSASLVAYALGSSGATAISQTAGSVPRWVALDRTQSYAYDADYTQGVVFQYAITRGSTGAVTALSPLSVKSALAPAGVSSVIPDNSGKYFAMLGYSGTNGLQLQAVGSGLLTASGSFTGTGTTTTVPAVMALTH